MTQHLILKGDISKLPPLDLIRFLPIEEGSEILLKAAHHYFKTSPAGKVFFVKEVQTLVSDSKKGMEEKALRFYLTPVGRLMMEGLDQNFELLLWAGDDYQNLPVFEDEETFLEHLEKEVRKAKKGISAYFKIKKAEAGDWKTQAFPKLIKELPYQKEFSAQDMEEIKIGFIPQQMEDKWFLYFEKNQLNIHRSWTGHKIYEVTFAFDSQRKGKVLKACVNRDPKEHNQQDDVLDLQLLDFLIERLLLQKPVPFPALRKRHLGKNTEGIYKEAIK